MSSGMKELKVWQESIALAGDVVRAARHATRRETKAFTDPLMHCAAEVSLGIATGYASLAPDDQHRAYGAARRALLELETRLAIARHAGLLQAQTLTQLTGRIANVNRLLSGYVAFLDRQVARGGAVPEASLTVSAGEG
jgi:four helix bundle protein